MFSYFLGDIVIPYDITVTVDSDLNGASPQFTLTCISTGGPATTVTWTLDTVVHGIFITEGTETVLDDRVTAQYTHTLTMTQRWGGVYTCTVANDKPSEAESSITIKGVHLLLCRTHCIYIHAIGHYIFGEYNFDM